MRQQRVGPLAAGGVQKVSTGIRGLDEVTGGGLPRGRATLLCGAAGCGKSLLATEFLVRGVEQHGEPGVVMTFEESAHDLAANAASLGLDVEALVNAGQLVIDHVSLDDSPLTEVGSYDLEGLFVRLDHAVRRVGAKRVVIDSIEALFGMIPSDALLRAELRRLCHWLKARGLTAIITAERGKEGLTRSGMEEYVSDCVIVLDHRVTDQQSTRRLRVLKYRGSGHGTNEFPFLIGDDGVCVLPISSASLAHDAPSERVSSGIADLDAMLGGQGLYRGGTTLISGTAGSGKTSISSHFAYATCRRGERCLIYLYEESPRQWLRNMRSIGLDLAPFEAAGLLCFHAARPSLHGLEMHLAVGMKLVQDFNPAVVVIDPVSSFDVIGSGLEVKAMLVRMIDFLKVRGCTVMMTSLLHNRDIERTDQEISSIVDTWLQLRDVEANGERNRCIYILKSRGMSHSNQVREFSLSDSGARLAQAYVGGGQVLTGSARIAQEAREAAERDAATQAIERLRLDLERRRRLLDSRVEALRAEFAAEEEATLQQLRQAESRALQQHMAEDAITLHRRSPDDGSRGASS